MNYKLLITGVILTAFFSCQETKKEDTVTKSEVINEEPAVGTYTQTTDIPKGILTPDVVETSIGTLNFFDGTPTQETVQLVYDNLDRSRGIDAFLKGIQGASLRGLIEGPKVIGAGKNFNDIMIFAGLLDSKGIFLTGNTSTLYVAAVLDLKKHGPMVVEAPPGLLGGFDNAWFEFVENIGVFGPDKGKGGKFLVLPPNYEGNIPSGYFVVKSNTNITWNFMRLSIAEGLEKAAKIAEDNVKVYPLSMADNIPEMNFVNASDKSFNTVHHNDYSFYEEINEVIQYEPLEMLDPETRGLFASIGIEKGKPFAPDARMKKILTDAVAIGNATIRSTIWYPRTSGTAGTMKGIQIYPDTNSAWVMAFLDKNVFFNGKDGHTMNTDARAWYYYGYTIVTPAMAVSIPGKGSDYGMAFVDSNKKPMDGSKTYKVTLPPNVPVNNFWAFTIYDTQTRSMLQTDQPRPSVGSQTKGFKENADGSMDVYFSPKAPEGFEGNWLQTIPGKSWYIILRMYGPLEPWLDKTWRPSEVIEVK
ncbi:DUF1254 domain-containing protein [Formosa sp. PL04]|uniref:DUF1254 domain-containing protein n=1 Tax=Formosa sp. PL04 TaxID=3081755 RepID=UPI0029825C25|nr:DUF1254 domain-containing protein [Formosa sp. PL04]MDW5290590.1 DUF1254 domain-containing protein [Formosa sp. PL04]